MHYYLVGVVLLLGILIFIHEFGHFYIAKICGMKVETFSIGMGPKICTFRRGETEYALSWIPFGGYVKILGQGSTEDIPEDELHRSFSNAPLWKRYAVVLAGPAANFILAFFVFWALFAKGLPSPSATIHYVHQGSPAASAGLLPGDKIDQVASGSDHASVRELGDLVRFLRLHSAPSLNLEVLREGQPKQISVQAIPGHMIDPMMGIDRESLVIPGVEFQTYAPIFTIAKNSQLSKKYNQQFFLVESAGKTELDSVYQLEKAFRTAYESKTPLNLLVQSIDLNSTASDAPTKPTTLELGVPTLADLRGYGFVPAHLMISQVLEGSAASKLGLQKGDILLELNRKPVATYTQFRADLQTAAADAGGLHLKWLRAGNTLEGEFIPQNVENEDPVTKVKERKFLLGASFASFGEASFEKIKAHGLLDGMRLAGRKTIDTSISILESFVFLLTGKVSVKAMGGPVMIGKIAGDSLRMGWDYFLKMLAMISLNLCVLNVMPLPVLDGGHILLFTVEGIIRRPIPAKFVEVWAMTGFVLLMGLALFVTFNDVKNLDVFSKLLGLFKK